MNKWPKRIFLVIVFTILVIVLFRSTWLWLANYLPIILSVISMLTGAAMVFFYYKGHSTNSLFRALLSFFKEKESLSRYFSYRFSLEDESVSKKRTSLLLLGIGLFLVGVIVLARASYI